MENADINERTRHFETLWFSNPEEKKVKIEPFKPTIPLETEEKVPEFTPEPEPTVPLNFKTVLCKWYEKYRYCKKENCTFAHGQDELNFNRVAKPKM
jgi:hypothetical protein